MTQARTKTRPAARPDVGIGSDILVPLDGSTLAERALDLALGIAGRTGGHVRVVSVGIPVVNMEMLGPGPELLMAETTQRAVVKGMHLYQDRLFRRSREAGVRIDGSVRESGLLAEGPVRASLIADEVLAEAHERGSDLIVIASHGHGGFRRAWLGSTADALVRASDLPVLVVPGEGEGPAPDVEAIEDIVVPLDGSPAAESVLDLAIDLARGLGARIVLFRVVVPPLAASSVFVPTDMRHDDPITASLRARAEREIAEVASRLRAQGVPVSTTVAVEERAADAILEIARGGADMIIMSTRGLGGARRLLLGSVADKVVRGAGVPVLVRRPAGDHG